MADAIEQTVSPTAEATQELEQSPVATSSDAGTEQTSQVEDVNSEETKPSDIPKKTPWYQARINELTFERKEAIDKAEREAAEVARLKAAIESGTKDSPASPPDIEKIISDRLAVEMSKKVFTDACNKTFDDGKKDYTDFADTIAQFGMLGELPQHFLEAVTALPGGHKVLYHLGKNLDDAAQLLALPPVQLGVKMAEIKSQLERQSTKQVSKAPAPIKPIDSGGKGDIDLSNASIDQFMELRDREAPFRR